MTAKQRAKLVKLIEGDCQLRHKYADGKGRYCVIGSMFKSCGVKTATLREYAGTPVSCLSEGQTDFLTTEFGLTLESLQRLQYANDAVGGSGDKAVAERRKYVLAALRNL